jgi:hypothetical protein
MQNGKWRMSVSLRRCAHHTVSLSLHFFLFCQPEDDEKQQELTLKKLLLLAFLAVEVRKSAKIVRMKIRASTCPDWLQP